MGKTCRLLLSPITHHLSPLFHRHSHSMFRAQGDDGQGFHAVAGDEAHAPVACERGEQQDSFHPREPFADAAARASAEWKVGELRPGLFSFRRPALRVKARRVWTISLA